METFLVLCGKVAYPGAAFPLEPWTRHPTRRIFTIYAGSLQVSCWR